MPTVKIPIYLAPLQGFTDAVFRYAFQKHFGGVKMYFTPFLRVEDGEIRRRELRDIEIARQLGNIENLVPQIMVSDTDEADLLITTLKDLGFNNIDLNFGCPYPMLNRKFKGAGILPHPDKVESVIRCLSKYSDTKFSLKMRLGMTSPDESLALADILNGFPFEHITIHPRTAKQNYSGEINEEAFAALSSVLKHNIVYNGDIIDTQRIDYLQKTYPTLHAVMIGRGLISNPFLALEYLSGEIASSLRREKFLTFHTTLLTTYLQYSEGGQSQVLDKMKTFWEYFLPALPHRLRKQILKSRNLPEYEGFVNIATREMD